MGWGSRAAALGALTGLLAGCSGYSPKSDFTPPSVSIFGGFGAAGPATEGKATVLLSSVVEGLTCAESRIVVARADGNVFKTVRVEKFDSLFGGGAGAAVIDLDPGSYHVVQVACRNGANVVYAGANPRQDAVPWQADHWTRSLASFAVADGDVLDAGALVVTPAKVDGFGAGINGRKASLAVRQSGEAALAEIVRVRPDLAPRLHSNPMQAADVKDLALGKCRLVAPSRPLPGDGSSKLTDALAEHPEAAPVIKSIGSATTEADGCVPEAAGGLPLAGVAATSAALAGQ